MGDMADYYREQEDWAELDNDGQQDPTEEEYRKMRARNYNRFYRNNKQELKEIISMKKLNKFYVGAEHISRAIANNQNDDWTCKSEADAIAHAKQILEQDPTKQVAIVVEVKYIIRRTKPTPPPIKVERVK